MTRCMNNNAKNELAPKHMLTFPNQLKLLRWEAPFKIQLSPRL
jgi:hypothetical protein